VREELLEIDPRLPVEAVVGAPVEHGAVALVRGGIDVPLPVVGDRPEHRHVLEHRVPGLEPVAGAVEAHGVVVLDVDDAFRIRVHADLSGGRGRREDALGLAVFRQLPDRAETARFRHRHEERERRRVVDELMDVADIVRKGHALAPDGAARQVPGRRREVSDRRRGDLLLDGFRDFLGSRRGLLRLEDLLGGRQGTDEDRRPDGGRPFGRGFCLEKQGKKADQPET
jgi:hypothetical protein